MVFAVYIGLTDAYIKEDDMRGMFIISTSKIFFFLNYKIYLTNSAQKMKFVNQISKYNQD